MMFEEIHKKNSEDLRTVLVSGRRRRRAIGMWLLLGVFFAYILAPLGLPAQVAGPFLAGTANNASAIANTIVICTTNGFKVVRLDGEGNTLPGETSYNEFCAYCLLFSISNVCDPGGDDIPFPSELQAIRVPVPDGNRIFGPDPRSSRASPRAPPLFFI